MEANYAAKKLIIEALFEECEIDIMRAGLKRWLDSISELKGYSIHTTTIKLLNEVFPLAEGSTK